MTMNPFANMNTEGMEEAKDVVGGSGFQPLNSGLYDGVIKMAYLGQSQNSKSRSVTFQIMFGEREYRETVWVTNRNDENFYVKEGKKYPLPGFVTVDELCCVSTGLPLSAQDFEEKVIKLYDFEAKAEVPTKVMAVTSLIGKPVSAAIMNKEELVTKKNQSTNEYEPTGEVRNVNEAVKFFHQESGKTTNELREGKEAIFKGEWKSKWEGKVKPLSNKDKAALEKAPKSGTPGSSAGSASAGTGKPASLFGKPA